MRVGKYIVISLLFLCGSLIYVSGNVAHAGYVGEPDLDLYNYQFRNLRSPALRVGDTISLLVYVHSASGAEPPTITADFSALGFPVQSATGTWSGYGDPYHFPSYYYIFATPALDSSIRDGVKDIPLIATDSLGNTASDTASIIVDNTLPTITLTSLTFSTTSPATGDYMYLSGSASGTGSTLTVTDIVETLLDENKDLRGPWPYHVVGYDSGALTDVIASSTDGTFTNIPFQLYEGGVTGDIEASAYFKLEVSVSDEAGNASSTVIIVPVPHPNQQPTTCTPSATCVSNVLFLPGIEGSRLYEGTGCGKTAEEKLWEPDSAGWDSKMSELSLDATGESLCSDIYTKEGDILGTTNGGNIYKSFIDQMNGLKTDHTINDWEPVAYDWRLSLNELLTNGAEQNGKIYYEQATSTPYIEQTLRALAANSKTGKVTIVAHSNGGLVAKALLNKLGATEAANLVDKIIMVGVPQGGAPEDIGATLLGNDAGISTWYGLTIVSNAAARALAQNSPMAYHLLPSENYFGSAAIDVAHPVIRFAGDAYPKEIAAYGNTITNTTEMDDFLLAKEGGRVKPQASDTSSAEILNPTLINYANSQHTTLDSWTPPAGIEVDQIAGWGLDTVGGIDFYSLPAGSVLGSTAPVRKYRPITIEDGDGIVPVPSALMMASSTNVKRYWLDLHSYNKDTHSSNIHKDLFEISPLQDFIKNLLGGSTSTAAYISTNQPATIDITKRLTFFLHSPLTLQLTDSSGHVTGLAVDGSVTQDIPGSTYSEFGEVKYVTVPEGGAYHLTMRGQASGTFSLDVQETTGDTITASSTIAGVPTTASTSVSMNVLSDVSTLSPMTIDKNGDGTIDSTVTPKLGGIVVFDTAPPEASIVVSTSTRDLLVTGLDDSPTSVSKTSTTTIITDQAGNTTKLTFQKTYTGKLLTYAKLVSIQYGTSTPIKLPSSFLYVWNSNTNPSILVSQTIVVDGTYAIQATYNKTKNQTTIIVLKKNTPIQTQTLAGLVLIRLTTNKGTIGYSW